MRTHIITGFATALLLSYVLALDLGKALIIALIVSMLNYAIDAVGHRGFRRASHTHSLLGIAIMIVVLAMLLDLAVAYKMLPLYMVIDLKSFTVLFTATATHLVLDMFTADGVPLLYPFTKKRISLTRRRYDDRLLNTFFTTISIIAIAASIYLYIHSGIIS